MAVKVEAVQGRLRLRWSHKGKRYCLSLGLDDTELGRALAHSRASLIDIGAALLWLMRPRFPNDNKPNKNYVRLPVG
jgi:hypothetical protein